MQTTFLVPEGSKTSFTESTIGAFDYPTMHGCSRIIKASIMERIDPELQKWWNKIFKLLEDDYTLPPEYRKEIIEEIFPTKVSNAILKILTMVPDPVAGEHIVGADHKKHYMFSVDEVKEVEEEPSPMTLVGTKLIKAMIARNDQRAFVDQQRSRKSIDMRRRRSTRRPTIASDVTSTYTETTSIYKSRLSGETRKMSNRPSTATTGSALERKWDVEDVERIDGKKKRIQFTTKTYNPYLKFFQANEDRVAIWRVLPPLTMDQMNLTQKADAIATAIAEDFIEWMTNMGGAEKANMDVEGVIKMFEIGFNTHAATSLCVRVREMPCVPPMVAIANNLPQFGKRETLRRHVMKDIAAAQIPLRIRGFNTMLPEDLIYLPPSAAQAERWMKCNVVPQELATMRKVWEGRTQLRSVRAYCQYLLKHPRVKRPKYLIDEGMFDENFLKQTRYSIESFSPEGDAFEAEFVTKPVVNM